MLAARFGIYVLHPDRSDQDGGDCRRGQGARLSAAGGLAQRLPLPARPKKCRMIASASGRYKCDATPVVLLNRTHWNGRKRLAASRGHRAADAERIVGELPE